MRIVINVNEKLVNHKRKVVMRIGYNLDGRDSIAVRNSGVEVYNAMAESLKDAIDNALIECEGERK